MCAACGVLAGGGRSDAAPSTVSTAAAASQAGPVESGPRAEPLEALERLCAVLYYEDPTAVRALLDRHRGNVDAALAAYVAEHNNVGTAPATPATLAPPTPMSASAPADVPHEPIRPRSASAHAFPASTPGAALSGTGTGAPSHAISVDFVAGLATAGAGGAVAPSASSGSPSSGMSGRASTAAPASRPSSTMRWLRPRFKKLDPATCPMLRYGYARASRCTGVTALNDGRAPPCSRRAPATSDSRTAHGGQHRTARAGDSVYARRPYAATGPCTAGPLGAVPHQADWGHPRGGPASARQRAFANDAALVRARLGRPESVHAH